ncbi:MAG TPA: hypothetical protein V6C69_21015 [Trichormus sp.]|jgi:tetratricopeptide (TPR) repeat protein
MDWIVKSQDALLVIIIPLMFVTFKEVRDNWQSLWDDNLTGRDRRTLLQASLFLLEPIVVLLHELGHATAIKIFGGNIQEFHYAVLSGYVVPSGTFTDAQILIIFLAGNLVQIVTGYLCFAVAWKMRSPAVVATLVYLGMWSIASSAIFYATMSIINLYGDWIAIYTSPVHSLVMIIGICHFFVVASVIYMLKGKAPRLWFAKRTRLVWAKQYEDQTALVARQPTHANLLRLAWLYYEASLEDMAKDALDRCQKLEPHDLEPLMLYGWLAHDKLQLEKAEANFMKIAKNEEAQPLLKARAYMGIADCQLSRMSRNANNRVNPEIAKNEALEALAAAKRADPSLADPYFHRAVLLNDLKRYPEAVSELQSLAGLNWLDRTLMKRVPEQMQRALNQQIATQ